MLSVTVWAATAGSIDQWTFVEIISVPEANLLYFDFSLDNKYDIGKSCNELLRTVFWKEEAVLPLNNLTTQDIAITKTTKSTYGTFLSSNWTLSKSSKSFHVLSSRNRSLLSVNDWNMDTFVNMSLAFPERGGFHNELHIHSNSSFFLFLPRGVYVDMDELRTDTDWEFHTVPSIINTEASSDQASAIVLHVSRKPAISQQSQQSRLDIHLPIHLRYILPFDADSTHHRSITIPPPFLRQDSHILLVHQSGVTLSIPSGRDSDAAFVFPLTTLVLLSSTYLLFVKILKYRTSNPCSTNMTRIYHFIGHYPLIKVSNFLFGILLSSSTALAVQNSLAVLAQLELDDLHLGSINAHLRAGSVDLVAVDSLDVDHPLLSVDLGDLSLLTLVGTTEDLHLISLHNGHSVDLPS